MNKYLQVYNSDTGIVAVRLCMYLWSFNFFFFYSHVSVVGLTVGCMSLAVDKDRLNWLIPVIAALL